MTYLVMHFRKPSAAMLLFKSDRLRKFLVLGECHLIGGFHFVQLFFIYCS
jgi:hypothetical protein